MSTKEEYRADAVAAAKTILKCMPADGIQSLKEVGMLGDALLAVGGARGASKYLELLIAQGRAMGLVVLVESEPARYEIYHEADMDRPICTIDGERAETMRAKVQSIQNKLASKGIVPPPRTADVITATMYANFVDAAKLL